MKFKVGDKVRVFSSNCDNIQEIKQMIGQVCEVDRVDGDGCIYVWQQNKENCWCFGADELELVKPKKSNNLLKRIKELEKRVELLEKTNNVENKKVDTKKITLDEFIKNESHIAIHCGSEKEIRELYKQFNKAGKNVYDFEDWIKSCGEHNFNILIYNNFGKNGRVRWDLPNKHSAEKIYEFEEVDLTIPQEPLLTEDEKVILKNMDFKR